MKKKERTKNWRFFRGGRRGGVFFFFFFSLSLAFFLAAPNALLHLFFHHFISLFHSLLSLALCGDTKGTRRRRRRRRWQQQQHQRRRRRRTRRKRTKPEMIKVGFASKRRWKPRERFPVPWTSTWGISSSRKRACWSARNLAY